MKKISFILCLLAFIFASCNEEKETDVTVMPDETTVGAQTFGCVVDGWLYVGGRFTDNYWEINPKPSINFVYNRTTKKTDVSVKVRKYDYITFTINTDKINKSEDGQEWCTFTNAKYKTVTENGSNEKNLGDGKVEITRFDDNVISGRFFSTSEGELIKHGRFDVVYVK